MSILDTTIVAVALATLGHDFHVSVTTIQWVSTGYLLALALVTPVTGWAVDRFGAKRIWMTSTALFVIGSSLCGAGLVGQLAHLLPRAPGHRRRHAAPGRPVDARPGRRPAAHGPGHEHHRRADGDGPDPGTRHRRTHRLQLQLALDLLHQRPDRHRHADPLAPLAAQVRHRRARHGRPSTPSGSASSPPASRPALCALRGRGDRLLHEQYGPHQLRPGRRADRCLHRAVAVREVPAARPASVPESQFRDRQYLHLRHRRHVVRLHVPAADLLPGRPGPGGVAGRPADGAPGHRRGVHHALGGRRHRPARTAPRGARSASS